MSFPLINPTPTFSDDSGDPLNGGTIEFRDPSTNAFINSYPTADDADAQQNANSNPVRLNARGEAPNGLFLEEDVVYRVILKDVNGVTIWTRDDVRAPSRSYVYLTPSGGDDTASIQAAIDDAPATGRLICLSDGTFQISSALSITTSGIHLQGAGQRATILRTSSATANMIEIGDGVTNPNDCSVEGMTFNTGIARTGGSCIRLRNAHNIEIRRVRMNAPYIGITFEGGASQFLYYLEQFEINDSVAQSIIVGSAGSVVQDLWISKGVIGSSTLASLMLLNISGMYTSDIDIINSGGDGIITYPGAGDAAKALFFDHVLCDTCADMGWELNTNGGTLANVNMSNCWGATNGTGATGNGLRISEGTGTIDGILIDGSRFTNNRGSGIAVLSGTNVTISDTHCVSNSQNASGAKHGIEIGPNVLDFTIHGGVCGLGGAILTNGQGYGILVNSGTSDRYTIIGVDVTGNVTGGISDGGSGTEKYIRDNIGHRTEASGTGEIANGTTSDVITHGLAVTPTLGQISIIGGENPTNDVGTIWVDTITSTQFTVNCENDPGASGFDFGWKVTAV